MENSLTSLINKLKIENEYCIYEDIADGFILPYIKSTLIPSCKKVLLTDEIIKDLKSKKIIDDMEFIKGEIQIKPTVSQDKKNTLIETEIQTYIAWEVKNSLGVAYFNDKDKAINFTNHIMERMK